MRNRAKLFIHDFKAFLYDAMARPGTGRIELAKNIADALVKKNTAAEATLLNTLLNFSLIPKRNSSNFIPAFLASPTPTNCQRAA